MYALGLGLWAFISGKSLCPCYNYQCTVSFKLYMSFQRYVHKHIYHWRVIVTIHTGIHASSKGLAQSPLPHHHRDVIISNRDDHSVEATFPLDEGTWVIDVYSRSCTYICVVMLDVYVWVCACLCVSTYMATCIVICNYSFTGMICMYILCTFACAILTT